MKTDTDKWLRWQAADHFMSDENAPQQDRCIWSWRSVGILVFDDVLEQRLGRVA